MPQVEIKIAPDGTTTMQGVGFVQQDCQKSMTQLAAALGQKTREIPHENAKQEQHIGVGQ